eukprot:jgi/Orpsp1_1/1186757/evm.model.d7180000053072.1
MRSPNPIYDMMILDERFLFSDSSMIENNIIEGFLKSRKIHRIFRDLTDYIKLEDLDHHDDRILNDAYHENHLYGIPYELDFDVIYHHKNDKNMTNIPSFQDMTWDDFLSVTKSSLDPSVSLLNLAYGDDDELLNFFIEYTNTHYDMLEETRMKDPFYFNLFYNETSETLYRSLQSFVYDLIGPKKNRDEALNTFVDSSYTSFINKESVFFKGKASYHSFQDKSIIFNLPPKDYSVVNEKYLVLNKNSLIETETLVKVALQLTSKEMQLYRAEKLGMIPTIDFSKNDTDIITFCESHGELCDSVKKMKKIRIKDIFKVNDYSAPFMEVRLTLPIFIDNLLRKNDIESLKLGCRNIVEARMIDFKNMINPSIVVLLIFMIICAIASLLIMLKVFKYRNHPYLKLISPNLSNIIIFGFTLSIFTPLTNIQNSSIERCKYAYVYGSISSNLILFPMLLVTYRIYAIYTNQSQVNIGKKLSNNRLLIAVMISLFLVCSSTIYIVFTKEFYISTTGSIASYRYPVCNHEENIIHAAFEMIYEYSI